MQSFVLTLVLGFSLATHAYAQFTTTRFVAAPAETLAIHRLGTGRTIIFIPGLLGSAAGFQRVGDQLAASGNAVTIVDLLGFGYSSRPRAADYSFSAQAARVHRFLQSGGVDRATVVCHAISTTVCLQLAAHAGPHIETVILINGGAESRVATGGVRTALRLAPLIKLIGANRIVRSKVKSGLIQSSRSAAWVTDSTVNAYIAPFGKNLGSVLDFLRTLSRARETVDVAALLERIDCPVYLVIGTGGPEQTVSTAQLEALRAIRKFHVIRTPAAGQYIHEEQPAWLAASISDWRSAAAVPVSARAGN